MPKSLDKNEPYSEISYGTEPTKAVQFLRTCMLRQFVRFFVLNLKVMKIVIKGHS